MNITTPESVPYKLAKKESQEDSSFMVAGEQVGGEKLLTIAGPCAVESREQILEIAQFVKSQGATALRGGAFKPRTSPYSFQGHGRKALGWLAEAREKTGLAIVTEVLDPRFVKETTTYSDVLQIGSRNMQNFPLLTEAAQSGHPILLKRGMANTIEEFLSAAEYILKEGNNKVMLCERGIRTFESATRNTFDINAIPVLKSISHLPVIADPSHGTGNKAYVPAVTRAAIAAGADGVIIEVHMTPEDAMSDGKQSLDPEDFTQMMAQMQKVAQAVDRTI